MDHCDTEHPVTVPEMETAISPHITGAPGNSTTITVNTIAPVGDPDKIDHLLTIWIQVGIAAVGIASLMAKCLKEVLRRIHEKDPDDQGIDNGEDSVRLV